jgi:class 3 adenylate cyclase/predicted ATPase
MSDLLKWLERLALGQYEAAFAENDIDFDALQHLTDQDLKDLGVSLGHRRKLLAAIGSLPPPESGGSIPVLPATIGTVAESASRGPPTSSQRSPEAERRQLTVMFCDLVESTALTGRLDAEDFREIIRAYQECCLDVVTNFEGQIAKYMGDGILVYFGYPQAHEDDAERAVRAGLSIVEAVRKLGPWSNVRLQVRMGVATGPVVVGDLIGAGAAQEQLVTGETPNLAARLQGVAELDSLVISERTRRLVGGLFTCVDTGPLHLKGFANPVSAWRVIGESGAASRFEALHTSIFTPLVGRDEEIALLLRRWEQAKEGEGQAVLISGEAGIGKSRLAWILRDRLQGEPHIWLSYLCSPYHRTSALHPFIAQLERAAGLTGNDPMSKLAKLRELLGQAITDASNDLPLFAALMSIPLGENHPRLTLSPQRQKEETLKALLAQLEGLASQRPVLMIFEDVHWIDPTSLELIEMVIDRVQSLPVLLIITCRPEFTHHWIGHAHVTTLSLKRLSRRQCAAIVDRLTEGKALPAAVLEQIVAKTDGVPLFVEELTKTVLESGLIGEEHGQYVLNGPLPPLAIPTTLQDSLMARLDRLAPVKELAQVGAAIGREFSYELLAAIAPMPDDKLRGALDQLVAAELVFRRGLPPYSSYTFKHALVQDAAYGSLLKGKRHQLHGRIAVVLEERFPETVEVHPEILAHHYMHAGMAEKAARYWLKAGQRAVARSAHAEAIAQLNNGLSLVSSLPEGRERIQLELDLRVVLGNSLMTTKSLGAPEVGEVYTRCRELCAELGETPQLIPVLFGYLVNVRNRGNLRASLEVAEEILHVASQRQDAANLMTGHRVTGVSLVWLGRLAEARRHLEQALALYDPSRHQSTGLVYAFDTRIISLTYLSKALLWLGYLDQAQSTAHAARAEAERLVHPFSLALALDNLCLFDWELGNRAKVRSHAKAITALATEQGFAQWSASGRFWENWASTDDGNLDEGLERMRESLAAIRATGAENFAVFPMIGLALTYRRAGRLREALDMITTAVGASEESGHCVRGELHRWRGELLLALSGSDHAEAEECFCRALAISRSAEAKLWELRAAMSLARLRRDQGKRAEARELFVPVCGWFREGLDTTDLREARALLDELDGRVTSVRVS